MQIDPVSGHVARCKKALEIWRTQKAKTKGVHGRRTSTYNDKKDRLYVPKLCKGPTRKTSASAHFSPPCLRPLVTPHHTSRPALPVSSSCPCPLARSTTTATRRAPESKPQRSATSTMQQRPPRHQPRPAPSGSGGTRISSGRHRNRQRREPFFLYSFRCRILNLEARNHARQELNPQRNQRECLVYRFVPSLVSPLHMARRVSPTPISPIIRSLPPVV
jgi:hypothetical protein